MFGKVEQKLDFEVVRVFTLNNQRQQQQQQQQQQKKEIFFKENFIKFQF